MTFEGTFVGPHPGTAFDEKPWRQSATRRRWRVYFNKREAFPHIWSVDEGTSDSEVLVQWVTIMDPVHVSTAHNLSPSSPPEQLAQPCAWLEFEGIAVFGQGGVAFYGRE